MRAEELPGERVRSWGYFVDLVSARSPFFDPSAWVLPAGNLKEMPSLDSVNIRDPMKINERQEAIAIKSDST